MHIAQVIQTFQSKTFVSDNDSMQKCCMVTKVVINIRSFGNTAVMSLIIWNLYMQFVYFKLSAVIYATLLTFQLPLSQFR